MPALVEALRNDRLDAAILRLPAREQEVMVLPIGIGDIGRETPEMTTTVIAKNPNPTWVPGPMVRKSWLEQKGIDLPAVVPPGPDNPLGKFAMRLGYGNKDYLIHGTNKPAGVGLRSSHGCIWLFPEDIDKTDPWQFKNFRAP